jgi:P-type conjugative transfer protein TrbG
MNRISYIGCLSAVGALVATVNAGDAHAPLDRASRTSIIRRANDAATVGPSRAGYLDAAQVYPWNEAAVYRLVTAPGRVSDIALQPGENLVAVAAGDTIRWIVGNTSSGSGGDKQTHILIKPNAPGLQTNVIITTDRRSYHLELSSTAQTAMTAIRWTYPADALLSVKAPQIDERPAVVPTPALDLAVERLSFNYRIAGDTPPWRPVRAFDDGRQTFIEFPTSLQTGEAPPLFVLGPNHDAELVNYRVRGHFYVVDRLFDAADLRLGSKPQQVVHINRDAGDRP